MKKIITLCLLALIPCISNAIYIYCGENFYLDFTLNSENRTAEISSGYCTTVDKIVIPETVTYMDVEYTVTSIAQQAFRNCDELHSITIPKTINYIGDGAFYGDSHIGRVNITDVGAWCNITFEGATSNPLYYHGNLYVNGVLASDLVIPEGVTELKNYVFYQCRWMDTITLPTTLSKIELYALYNCNYLREVYITDLSAWCNISIDMRALGHPLFFAHGFYLNGTMLGDLVIPEGVTSISDDVFRHYYYFTSITIPKSLTSIGQRNFIDCQRGIESITVHSENNVFDSRDNCNAIIETDSNKLIIGCKNSIIPKSIRIIEKSAFSDCVLEKLYCYAKDVPYAVGAFSSKISKATLYVPASSLSLYQETEPWSNFGEILPLDEKKCATPTINYVNGKLHFSCDTEGATFVCKVKSNDTQTYYGNDISLTATFEIDVFAKADGYEDSDVSTSTIVLRQGDMNGDGEVNIIDATSIVNVILNQ